MVAGTKVWNGSAFVDPVDMNVWNGSAMVDAKSAWIWNGSAFVKVWPPPIQILGSARAFTNAAAASSVTTTSTLAVDLSSIGTLRDGDFLVATLAMGTATPNATLDPAAPSVGTWTARRTYNSVQTWLVRTLTAQYVAAMGSSLTFPITVPSGSPRSGGAQVDIVALRNVDPTTPVASVTGMTGGPTGATAGTAHAFPTVTPGQNGCALVWSVGAFSSSAAIANDASWTAGATEQQDSGGPRCNGSNGTAHAFMAAAVQTTAAATGVITCTTTNSRQYRDGCVLVLNPA